MAAKSIESQAREYLYDVKNCASEFGQSTLENWEFSLVSDIEKRKIEKDYYPTVSAQPAKEALMELFNLVKSKLNGPDKSLNGLYINPVISTDLTSLIAFNPKLHR